MRTLSTLLSPLVFLLIIGVAGFFISREYLLYQGVVDFKKSVQALQKMTNTADQMCQSRVPDLLEVRGDQQSALPYLKFIDSKQYVIEVLCPTQSFDPQTLATYQLFTQITKVPGTSGILMEPEGTSGVELAVFADLQNKLDALIGRRIPFIEKTRSVAVLDGQVVELAAGEDLGAGPLATCQGYGFKCCQPEVSIGNGDFIQGAIGCEQACYSSCTARPVILSFSSNPFMDVRSRTVTIDSGNSIDFAFAAETAAKKFQVVIDYGDGETDIFTTETGESTHAYSCSQAECLYTAGISITDADGVTSMETGVTSLTVKVSTYPSGDGSFGY
jgi:hypothetical protein